MTQDFRDIFFICLPWILNAALLWLMAISCLSCSAMPEFFGAAEHIADDDAVKCTISREAIRDNTDINIKVDVTNKDASHRSWF